MIRALWFAVKIGALIALAIWIAERPGTVRIEWVEYTIIIHIGLFLLGALAFVLLTLFIYQTIKTFVDFPKSLARYNEIKDKEKGYQALTRGLTAVAAGDSRAANIHAKRASKLLKGDTGLPLLLEAQAARLDGREDDAAQSFVALLEDKDASFLGVRGLLQTAMDSGDDEAALALAEKALALHPKQGWILKITYDLHIRLQQWYRAEKILGKAEKFGAVSADKARSDRLALYLAQAEKDMGEGYGSDATLMIRKALKLDPGFAPAVMALADLHVKEGHPRKAQSLVLKAWKTHPHGGLAEYWLSLLHEDKATDKLARLRWCEKLLKANADSAAGQLMAGRAAMDAGLWGEAREFFKRAEDLHPSASLYQALATLEERSGHDETAIKNWLEKAAGAPAEKAWLCRETGLVYPRWAPVAQPHGSFNTIEWRAPSAYGEPVVLLNDDTAKRGDMADALIEAPDVSKPDTDVA